jgi:hypothetical protein
MGFSPLPVLHLGVIMPDTLQYIRDSIGEDGWSPQIATIVGFLLARDPTGGAFPAMNKKKPPILNLDADDHDATLLLLRQYCGEFVDRYWQDRRKTLTLHDISTVNDPAIDVVLRAFAGIEDTELVTAHHRRAMSAENLLGALLERYLAHRLEPEGWVWCAGSVVKHVDFLGPDGDFALQVKNRDNSENSSSKAIRKDTNIHLWFRGYAKSGKTNWSNFPAKLTPPLSEEEFHNFITQYQNSDNL